MYRAGRSKLVMGLGLTMLTAYLLYLLLGENQRVARLVALRTRELQKVRDEALRASKVKNDFLAGMSHELRTPLNSIIGFTARLLSRASKEDDPRTFEALEIVSRNGRHLLELVNDILDLSKIESGKLLRGIAATRVARGGRRSLNSRSPRSPISGAASVAASLQSESSSQSTPRGERSFKFGLSCGCPDCIF